MGAFSKGVIKAENREALTAAVNTYVQKKSSLLLVQNTLYRIRLALWCVKTTNLSLRVVIYIGERPLADIYQHSESSAESGGL